MAAIAMQEHRQALRRRLRGRQRCQPGHRRRRVRDPGRAVRLRQVDAAADDRGAGGHHLGRHAHRRQAGQRQGTARPQPLDGVPELRALSAPVASSRTSRSRCGCGASSPRARCASGSRRRRHARAAGAPRPQAGQLSGGQRQRVAMGRAIVRQADAFLFDEPLSNLDAKLRGQMRTEILRMQRRLGTTTVYVTHDQTEAMTLGRPGCGAAEGRAAAGRHSARAVRAAGQPVRGRVHRLAADELHPGRVARATRCELPFASFRLRAGVVAMWPSEGQLLIVGIRPEPSRTRALVDRTRPAGA